MRQVIWAALSAAILVSTVSAQTVAVPGQPIAVDPPKRPIVTAPPDWFFHPCDFVLTGQKSDCPPPTQPTVCMASEKRCSALSKAPGKMVPI